MKTFITVIITILTIYVLSVTTYAYDPIKIAYDIKSFKSEITADSGNIEQILKDAFDCDPRLVLYYKGYRGSKNSYSSVININYDNTDIPIDDIYFASNKGDLISLITRALLYSENRICITSQNIPADISIINEYISEISKTCPIAFTGYRGNSISALDIELGGYCYYIINFEYDFDKETLNNMKKKLEQKACEIIASNIARDMPPYMKVFIIHNYIINNCKYASDYTSNSDPSYYTAYGALVNGKAVCDGYASAAKILFDFCGIENIKVSGTSKGVGHAWNLIKLDNDYYHIDTTWDDPVSHNGIDYLKYNYYNLTDSEISYDHIWNAEEYPKANGSIYTYEKTIELIKNDKNSYTDGYTSFNSVFGEYTPLTGSINPNEDLYNEHTETTSLKTIEPASILNETNDNLHINSDIFINIITGLLKNPMAAFEIIFVIVLIFAVVRKIF